MSFSLWEANLSKKLRTTFIIMLEPRTMVGNMFYKFSHFQLRIDSRGVDSSYHVQTNLSVRRGIH